MAKNACFVFQSKAMSKTNTDGAAHRGHVGGQDMQQQETSGHINLFEQNNKKIFCDLFGMLYEARQLLFYQVNKTDPDSFNYNARQTILKLLFGFTEINDQPFAAKIAIYKLDQQARGCVTFVQELQLIEVLVTNPIFRGQGIGTQLVHYATNTLKAYAQKNNIHKPITIQALSSNTPTCNLYQKLGFTPTSEKDIQDNTTSVVTMHLSDTIDTTSNP